MLQIGDAAPEFCLPCAPDGKADLRTHSGHRLLLYFFPRAATSGCTKQAQELAALFPQFQARDCAILGVSADSLAKQTRFHRAQNLPFALACDETHKVLRTYGVWQEKQFYGRKFMGIVRSSFLIGRDSQLVKIWRQVRVRGHAAEVLAALDAPDALLQNMKNR